MKINEFIESTEISNFAKKCLLNQNQFSQYNVYDYTMYCINKSKDINDFKKTFFKNAGTLVKLSQAYAVLSKETDDHWYRVREMLGDRVFKTYSDVGGLKIGNDEFSIIIQNGYGDGITRTAVFSKEDSKRFNSDMMEHFTMTKGKINIYKYDCTNEIIKQIEGKYMIYYYEGLIAFVEF